MYGYIYETICTITNKKYIGLHKWLLKSLDENYIGSGTVLKAAVKKYGRNAFKCRVIEFCGSREELAEREKYWIDYFNADIDPDYYNISTGGIGGDHGDNYKQPVTPAMLKALEAGRHLSASERQRKQLSERRKGINVSIDTRIKLREAALRHSNKTAGRIWISKNNVYKRVQSEDFKNYIDTGWSVGGPKQSRSSEFIERYRKASSGRVHINKDGINKSIPASDLNNYLSDNWKRGWVYRKKFND